MKTKETFFLTRYMNGHRLSGIVAGTIPAGINQELDCRIAQQIVEYIELSNHSPITYDEVRNYVYERIGAEILHLRPGSNKPLEDVSDDNLITYFTYVWMVFCSMP